MTTGATESGLGGVVRRWLVVGVAVIWTAGWVWFARYHLLDDALIHLRYADFLWERGRLTYDGVESSWGTSSLLYVLLLAPIRAITDAALVVKVVSSTFYLGLLALIAAQVVRSADLRRALWAAMGLALVSPMGVRWLTDGMETSLVAFASVALPLVAHHANAASNRPLVYAGMLALGIVLFLLRIEMVLLAVAASASIWLDPSGYQHGCAGGGRSLSTARIVTRNSGLLVGVVACALVVYVVLGQLLPDTAVAKSTGEAGAVDALRRLGLSTAAALTLGAGLSALWAASLWSAAAAARSEGRSLLPLAAANAVIVVLVLAVAVRGQEVAGFRNVMWALLFMASWNIVGTPENTQLPGRISAMLSQRTIATTAVVVVAVGLLLAAWAVEGYFVKRIVDDRSEAYADMRVQELESLSGLPGVAFDIGFVGYFTSGVICDVNGLVNGPEAARLSDEERALRCAQQSPAFSFVTPSQAIFVQGYMDMGSWVVCHEYLFTNLRVPEPHYLIVEPRLAKQICPRSTSTYGETNLG